MGSQFFLIIFHFVKHIAEKAAYINRRLKNCPAIEIKIFYEHTFLE